MTFEEKLEVADFLDEMGVDIIEAGFPIASRRRLRGRVARSPSALKNVGGVRAVARRRADIDRAGEAVKHAAAAAHPHLHLHLARASQAQAAEVGRAGAGDDALPGRAARATGRRTWSGRPRTPPAPRSTTCAAAWRPRIKAGATTINLPDTVGYATPEEYYADVPHGDASSVPGADKVIFSVHCHNDLGMAVANSLAGVRGRRAAGRMHHQRHRRAGRQRRAGRGRDGASRRAATCCPIDVGIDATHAQPRLASWCRRRPRSRCSTTRRSSAATRSRTRAASTRTACSSTRRPTRS